MSIEINGPHTPSPAELGDSRAAASGPSGDRANANPAAPTGNDRSGDRISLTSEAEQLQALEDKITQLPVVDTQRVEAVQRSLATGSFQIDPARVADKMLQFESALDTGT